MTAFAIAPAVRKQNWDQRFLTILISISKMELVYTRANLVLSKFTLLSCPGHAPPSAKWSDTPRVILVQVKFSEDKNELILTQNNHHFSIFS